TGKVARARRGGLRDCEQTQTVRRKLSRALAPPGFLLRSVAPVLGLGHVCGLGALLSLHDFELHGVAFLECFVALCHDGGVMDEYIGATVLADESVALCVIEPFHFSRYFQLLPLLELSWDEGHPETTLRPGPPIGAQSIETARECQDFEQK